MCLIAYLLPQKSRICAWLKKKEYHQKKMHFFVCNTDVSVIFKQQRRVISTTNEAVLGALMMFLGCRKKQRCIKFCVLLLSLDFLILFNIASN